jgi:glycosyltransferase involved in cell wall biosynthesis
MRERNVKAVWIQGWQVAGYWQAVWAAKEVGVEVWLRGESNDLAPTPIWKRTVKGVVLGQLFRRVDRFLYIGSANRRLYERFGVTADRLYPAPYAVDNVRFAAQAEKIRSRRSEIRSQWGIVDDAFCVLFCGKFIPKKRPLDLVKAAQLLISDNQVPNIHLLFVGSGELGSELRSNCNVVYDVEIGDPPNNKQLIANNQKPRASFAGFLNQTEISQAYVAADCLVMPSDYRETWGLVVNEAMASELPCLISDQCGCSEDLGRFARNSVYRCSNLDSLACELNELTTCGPKQSCSGPPLPSFMESVSTVGTLYPRACGFK